MSVVKVTKTSREVKTLTIPKVVDTNIDTAQTRFIVSQNVVNVEASQKVVNTKIRGKELDTSKFIYHETPTPATDGVQKVFTVANSYVSGLLEVFMDGLLQIKDTDYTETTSTTFTMTNAPDSDEILHTNYIKQ